VRSARHYGPRLSPIALGILELHPVTLRILADDGLAIVPCDSCGKLRMLPVGDSRCRSCRSVRKAA
jgi:hypothetical protein